MTNQALKHTFSGLAGKKLLRWVFAGLCCLLAVMLVVGIVVPPQNAKAASSRIYDYSNSNAKSESVAFTTTNMSDNGILTFASSELTAFYLSGQSAETTFGEITGELNLTFVGEAFDQCLWQAIAAGAYANSVSNKKVVLMLSPQWFSNGSGNQSDFNTKFSYSLYKGFLENENISDSVKSYVRERISALDVDETKVAAANHDTFLDTLNDLAFSFADDVKIRTKLLKPILTAPERSAFTSLEYGEEYPDWDQLLSNAQREGALACTNNDYGIYDSYYERKAGVESQTGQDFVHADSEYADFACFLEVCKEAGLEPLVVILPLHGSWYDDQGVTAETRAQFYYQAKAICDDADVTYADFSSCEYEKYFLCDTSHPGWVGWVRIQQAIYDYVKGNDNVFLGGAGYGEAKGLPVADNSTMAAGE